MRSSVLIMARGAFCKVLLSLVMLMFLPYISIMAQNGYRVTYLLYGEGQIWTIDPDGSNPQMLGNLPDVSPHLSPDGQHIAYIGSETGGDFVDRLWDLYVSNPSTGEAHTLVSQQRVTNISWSPDSERLIYFSYAYDSHFQPIGDLFVVNADGTNPILLASDQQLYTAPSWSPDGSMILFVSRDGDVETLYAVNADGTNLRALHSDIPCFICDAPRWTPDGRFIVYMDYPNLYRMDTACLDAPDSCDDATLQLTEFESEYNAIDVSYARYGKPIYAIASDSSFLIYTFGYNYDGGGIDIARMSFDEDGWQNRQILYHGDFARYGALLSPDDQSIFFNDADTIYRMNADGSQLTPVVTGTLYGFLPASNP